MSQFSEEGFEETLGLSVQTESPLKENQRTLTSMQAAPCDSEDEQKLRRKTREVLLLEDELELLQQQHQALHDRYASVSRDNTRLQAAIAQQGDDAREALTKFNTYRNKMEAHRSAVVFTASQTAAGRDLLEKKALVRTLKEQREELREDLKKPNGNAVQTAKREADALKEAISEKRRVIAEKNKQLREEFRIQAQIKKDTEIHSRRYEAVVKRLRCQLSRAQAAHRKLSHDVFQMRRKLAELKKRQDNI